VLEQAGEVGDGGGPVALDDVEDGQAVAGFGEIGGGFEAVVEDGFGFAGAADAESGFGQ
jgi:hypothetical protein